jgi:hypothetical protein
VLSTPSVKAATLAETIAAAALPAATIAAAVVVDVASDAGTHADAASRESAAASAAAERTSPRRASRRASSPRPRASRLDTVPSGQPSCRAASPRLRPSRSQSTTGARYRSGSRLSSWSSSGRRSGPGPSSRSSVPGTSSRGRSCARRRAAAAFALSAVRRATPYSQLPTRSRGTTEDALRTRTRNVAWKASSASCSWPSTRRQTPSTIGPCRRTSTANAASSRHDRKRSSSCPSVRVVVSRSSTARRRCPRTLLICPVSLEVAARGRRGPSVYYCLPGEGRVQLFSEFPEPERVTWFR